MELENLQKALAILTTKGNVGKCYAYPKQLEIYIKNQDLSSTQIEQLKLLGFSRTECGEGFQCFT